MINKQRDIIIKAKKDCYFEYTFSYKAVSKGSYEKEYIRTLKCLKYTYLIYFNLFLFKAYEMKIIKY